MLHCPQDSFSAPDILGVLQYIALKPGVPDRSLEASAELF